MFNQLTATELFALYSDLADETRHLHQLWMTTCKLGGSDVADSIVPVDALLGLAMLVWDELRNRGYLNPD